MVIVVTKNPINYNSPIYLQLRELIRSRIEEEEYPPGSAIPSENELAKTYGVNRLTVRSAVDALVNEGILLRIQGKGTFVVGNRLERNLDSLGGFRQSTINHHANPSVKILSQYRRKAGPFYSSIFNINPDDQIFFIRRLNQANNEPISIEYNYIPCYKVPKLDAVDLSIFTLYELYDFYHVSPVYAFQTLDLVPVEAHDARSLELDSGAMVLMFSCTSYDSSNDVIEYTKSFSRNDKSYYTIHNR